MTLESILFAIALSMFTALLSGSTVFFYSSIKMQRTIDKGNMDLKVEIAGMKGELKAYCADRDNDEKRLSNLERTVFENTANLNKLRAEHETLMHNHNQATL